jgi:tungstate transport system substrate-binding protein
VKKAFRLTLIMVLLAALLAACAQPTPAPTTAPAEEPTEEAMTEEPAEEAAAGEPSRLILATTTSTYDSGLLDYILPDFEEKYNATVDVIAVGTGQALEMGEAGDADVLLVHARAREEAFVEAGHGTARYDVMYNDFVIIGPPEDPAGIKGMESAADAFATIAEQQATFISRGDDSGTHTKEKAIWAEAGIEPSGDWYEAAGQGMGAVITLAEEQQAYTLSDRATYLARKAEGLTLEVLVEGDPILFNPYGVIPVNPDKNEGINNELANQFVEWITSVDTQELIASYERDGAELFYPDSAQWHEANP